MDEKHLSIYRNAFIVLDKIEDELIPIKETLEKRYSSIQKRIDNYEIHIPEHTHPILAIKN